jgi:hypothetical protein
MVSSFGNMVPSDSEILAMDNVLPAVAAKYIGETPVFVRLGLQQNRLPIGSAVQNPSGKWSYNISPGLLVAYKRGTLRLEIRRQPFELHRCHSSLSAFSPV